MKKYSCLMLLIGWVLWTRTQSPTNDGWTAVTGFNTREQCAANMKEKMDVWRQFKDARFGNNTVTFTGNNTTMTFICLTDDEDPRRKPKLIAPKEPTS